jgi:uncharacterized protein HemX
MTADSLLTKTLYQPSTNHMDVKEFIENTRRFLKLAAFAALLVVLSLAGWRWLSVSDTDLTATVHAQQNTMLEQRLNQIEQRFYYLETRLNRLESDARYSGSLPGNSSTTQLQIGQMKTDIDTMRGEIDSLRSRVGDLECGLLKIDERTLSTAARQRRRMAAGRRDPCRAEPETPVELASRP